MQIVNLSPKNILILIFLIMLHQILLLFYKVCKVEIYIKRRSLSHENKISRKSLYHLHHFFLIDSLRNWKLVSSILKFDTSDYKSENTYWINYLDNLLTLIYLIFIMLHLLFCIFLLACRVDSCNKGCASCRENPTKGESFCLAC